jgi:geranylgeranyl pyrophosphate synthase
LKRAQDLVTDAKSALNTINPSPARDLLATLADGILDRKF